MKTNTVKIGLLVAAGIAILACTASMAQEPAESNAANFGEEVSVKTVALHKGKEGVVVLDVREPSEYADEHIPGVVHIPMGQALDRKAEYIQYKTVFVTCRSGNRSGQVTSALRAQGHRNVHNMSGGIKAWKYAGLPTER